MEESDNICEIKGKENIINFHSYIVLSLNVNESSPLLSDYRK
jgi:hypothetical protein